MNRQIKFRGKRIDTGDWVTGWFYFFEGAYIRYCHQTCHHDEGPQNSYTDYEVMPETIGQYTGLKDKNEVEIYEGCELKLVERRSYLFGEVGKVVFESDYGGFIVEGKWSKNQHHELLTCDVAIDCEVNPPADSPALNTMTTDPKEGQEEVKDDQAAINAAEDQANTVEEPDAEEGNTEG